MSEYPDSDEEFELQYGDELDLINEIQDYDEPVVKIPQNNTSRRSLDYGEPKSKSTFTTQSDIFKSQSQENGTKDILNSSFETDFQPLSERNGTQTTLETSQQDTATLGVTPKDVEPTKKRTIEELFGDIDDLLFENERKSKKVKASTKYEEQMEMIEQILELRKLKQENNNLLFRRKTKSVTNEERNKMNLSWRVPNYPFMSITRHDKEKVYIRCHSDSYEKEDVARVINDINFVGVMGDMFKETWQKAQKIVNKSMDNESKSGEDTTVDVGIIEEVDQELWVDLYRPRRYLELLSDETTNRILLKWLKLWDKCVFNRRPKIKSVKPDDANQTHNKFEKFNFLENQLKLDEDGRPSFKVALLCGRPGLGKTTLAHIVAKHAGYNVIEINASDDRSLEYFRTSLENATQMSSVVDQQKRPNCIIFDEIDGAPTQSIEYLVKFISGTHSKAKKKEKKKTTILKRPIICICNDAYVPALRSLRQMAFVVNFPPTSSGRLSERLIEIARRQQLKTDSGAMLALAEKSNNDIRSCLSILHFFKAQKKPVTLSDVFRSNVGQKDMQKGLFSVWTDIFSIERSKVKFSGVENLPKEDRIEEYDMTHKSRMRKILNVVQSFGDYERLTQGVFENFPDMQFKEASLNGTCHALDWFCYTDKINQYVMAQQNYSLTSYLPYAFVVWHFQFSSLTWPKVKYPSEGYEVRQKLTNNLATIKELEKGIPPKTKIFVNPKNLILDILPSLTRIITPPFRPVNLHLFTPDEKKMFSHVVDIMIDYNLNYIQEKNTDGIYEFKLDPDVLPIVTYPMVTSQNSRSMSYFNKQLISREVELGRIKKIQMSTSEGVDEDGVKGTKQAGKNEGVKGKGQISPGDEKLPNHLRTLKVKSLKKIDPATTKDFFGRTITTSEESDTGSKGPQLSNDIWFKYKEGYSNAVRKKIKMSILL